ncbi:hypothetical protein HanRHA438_Chr17g0815551 [Helianthus annuus]|nr:hypothetical protein HanRHA438_Chr17g0815551 [Helianthus annuus]
MDQLDLNHRSLESKHERRYQTISLPPLPLVVFSGVVIFLLSLSQYSNFMSWSSDVGMYLQLFLILIPVICVLLLSSSSITQRLWVSFSSRKQNHTVNMNPLVYDPYVD